VWLLHSGLCDEPVRGTISPRPDGTLRQPCVGRKPLPLHRLPPIRDAALSLGPAPDDGFQRRLSQKAPSVEGMAYAGPDGVFSRPGTLGECLSLLAQKPRFADGGGRNGSWRWNRICATRKFPHLVSVGSAAGTARVRRRRRGGGNWRGAHAGRNRRAMERRAGSIWRMAALVRIAVDSQPRDAGRKSGHRIAHRGMPHRCCWRSMAEVKIAGPSGIRMLPLDAFFTGYRRTAMEAGELLVSVRIPKPLPDAIRFFKAFEAASR